MIPNVNYVCTCDNHQSKPASPYISSATVSGTAATTAPDTQIEVDEAPARAFVFDPGIELQTLVDALNETGTTATDMVAILEALREAGALRAELIII